MNYIFILPLLLAFLFSRNANAQQEVMHHTYVYCTISPSHNLFSSKIKINVDYGQRNTHLLHYDKLKHPETGAELDFNSIIDALNYMSLQGWDFVQTYVQVNDGESRTFWLLRKDLDKEAVPE